MRCASLVLIACSLVGCRNQAVPVTNPFMGPTVVPAPATRAPAPGTAAPYYPGDAIPGAVPPANPAPVTPGIPYNGPPATYGTPPGSPPPAVQPPGGWNSYAPPVSQTFNNGVQPVSANVAAVPGDAVQVPTDNDALRFSPSQPAVSSPPTAPAVDGNVAQVQFVNESPPLADQRPVVLREINSQQAESYQSRSSTADGFRPQGSSRTAREQNRFTRPAEPAGNEPTTPTYQAANSAAPQEVADRFGFDPQYTWLRGKLEQSPTTGQWQLRYVPQQGQVDQFGGSLSIANPQVLGGSQNGDYVAVQGQLQMVQLGTGANVPTYTVNVLQRQQFDVQ